MVKVLNFWNESWWRSESHTFSIRMPLGESFTLVACDSTMYC